MSNNELSEEFWQELRQMHDKTHSVRQPGEFTVDDYMRANPGMGRKTAGNELYHLAEIGKVEKVAELRYIEGRMRAVYKIVK